MPSTEDLILSIFVLTEDPQVCILCASYEILSVLRLTKPTTILERDIRRYVVGNIQFFVHS